MPPAQYATSASTPTGPFYDFCLSVPYAEFNLLPELRQPALELFAELRIPWHRGVAGGPSNHLLSSQVQCVNALGQMVTNPQRLKLAFEGLLGIDEVLQVERGRYLTFEYIGPTDFFGEAPGGQRTRGANCTSVDAAFLHRAKDGAIELVLVEWKYTEAYSARQPNAARDTIRLERYGPALADPDGPVRADLLPFALLLDEPFYQLVRQQLLAAALERTGAHGASRVRVLHVVPPNNLAYQRSLARPEHRALGDTVSQVWQRLLRTPDRFLSVGPDLFLDSDITSREYAVRYGDNIAWDEKTLLSLTSGDVEDYLYIHSDFDGGVQVNADEVELQVGRIGMALQYPFRLQELHDLGREMEADSEGPEASMYA